MFSKFFSENRVVYEIMWKKCGRTRQATDGNIIWYMCIACWITEVTETHSEYAILIALARQQLLRERARYYVYTQIACLVNNLTNARFTLHFSGLRQLTSEAGLRHWNPANGECVLTLILCFSCPPRSSRCNYWVSKKRSKMAAVNQVFLYTFTGLFSENDEKWMSFQ